MPCFGISIATPTIHWEARVSAIAISVPRFEVIPCWYITAGNGDAQSVKLSPGSSAGLSISARGALISTGTLCELSFTAGVYWLQPTRFLVPPTLLAGSAAQGPAAIQEALSASHTELFGAAGSTNWSVSFNVPR